MPINIFTTIDDPLATTRTIAFGINDAGQIVGTYTDASGGHGFLLSSGSFTPIDDPSATLGTIARGINNTGQIVGLYNNVGIIHGFLLNNGTFTTIDVPAASRITEAFGINNSVTIELRLQGSRDASSRGASGRNVLCQSTRSVGGGRGVIYRGEQNPTRPCRC